MRIALQNFTGGEISPTLGARYDLTRYRNCVACMENMLPGLHGDAARRSGTLRDGPWLAGNIAENPGEQQKTQNRLTRRGERYSICPKVATGPEPPPTRGAA